MTILLDLDDLLRVARRVVGTDLQVRDYGLLESALARPAATVFGEDAYPSIHIKAAALLHSLAKNHALVDGNKRLAYEATFTFLYINGHELFHSEDEGYDFVIAVASGQLEELGVLAEQLLRWSRPT